MNEMNFLISFQETLNKSVENALKKAKKEATNIEVCNRCGDKTDNYSDSWSCYMCQECHYD